MKRLPRLLTAAALAMAAAFHVNADTRVEVGYIPILASTPLFLLEAEGWAKTEGLELNLTKFEAGTAAIQALAAGKIDVLYAGIGPVLVARGKGVDAVVVANSAVEELALVARGELAELSRKVPAAEAVARLAENRSAAVKIATQPPGSVPDVVLRHWIKKVTAVDSAKVELVSQGIEKTQQALLAGVIDAAMVREPTITVITKADPQAAVLALGGEMFPGQPGTVVATRSAFVRDNREAVAKLVALHVKAVDAVRNDKARAAKAAWEFIGKGLIEESVLTEALASPSSKFISDPRYIVEAAQRMQDFQTELGIPSSAAPAAQAFDYSFYDAVIGKVAELK